MDSPSPEKSKAPRIRYGIEKQNLSWDLMKTLLRTYGVKARGEEYEDITLESGYKSSYDSLMAGETDTLDLRLGTRLNPQTKLYFAEDHQSTVSFSVYVNGRTADEDSPLTEAGRPLFELKEEIELAMEQRLHDAGVAVEIR